MEDYGYISKSIISVFMKASSATAKLRAVQSFASNGTPRDRRKDSENTENNNNSQRFRKAGTVLKNVNVVTTQPRRKSEIELGITYFINQFEFGI